MSKKMRIAVVQQNQCVGCGCCKKACPRKAIDVPCGVYAVVDATACVGCGLCAQACPATVIQMVQREGEAE